MFSTRKTYRKMQFDTRIIRSLFYAGKVRDADVVRVWDIYSSSKYKGLSIHDKNQPVMSGTEIIHLHTHRTPS